jgi:hypothetical protein
MLMNALPHLEVLIEATLHGDACWDELTQPQDEGAFEDFIDGAGI